MATERRLPEGIRLRHSRECQRKMKAGSRCTCTPSYAAWVYDRRGGGLDEKGKPKGQKMYRSFSSLSEARGWRADALSGLRHGTMKTPTRTTVREEGERWLARAEAGEAFTRSGRTYKPGVVRGVESDLRLHVFPAIGAVRLSELRRRDVQAMVDRLRSRPQHHQQCRAAHSDGPCTCTPKPLSGSKVRGVVTSLKVVLRRPLKDDELAHNPTERLELPPPAGTRDRAASAIEAAELIDALPKSERALWATALYAGLRRGELQALRFEDVDLAKGTIRVARAWDRQAGEIDPKSAKGKRTVPIAPVLLDYLAEHKAATGRSGADLVFGSRSGRPFTPTNVHRKARAAWAAWNKQEAETAEAEQREPKLLVPLGLHEARHSFVSMMADAGFDLPTIGDFVGHSSSYMTDAYRHLLDGAEEAAAKRFGEYLERANTAARLEQLSDSAGSHSGAQEPQAA
jgi:integrase